MTIQDALIKYKTFEIELLLAHVTKKSKEFVFLHPEKSLSASQMARLSVLIKRRQKGEPIAYILGYKDFYGLRFKVNKSVLIPRPETEIMVDTVIERLKDLKIKRPNSKITILDLGTGSGAIAAALAKQLQATSYKLSIAASDISRSALNIARSNFIKHGAKVRLVQSDLLKNIKFDFDVLVANLPYLDKSWVTKSIKHEPKQALFAKERGLFLYRKLLGQIAVLSSPPSLIYLEFDPRQKSSLKLLVKTCLPNARLTLHKDRANLWRFAEIAMSPVPESV